MSERPKEDVIDQALDIASHSARNLIDVGIAAAARVKLAELREKAWKYDELSR